MIKCFRKYRGVKIYKVKEMIPGSDFVIAESTGCMHDRKPKYDIFYKYAHGAKEFTIDDVKESIDRLHHKCVNEIGDTEKNFIEMMNESPETDFDIGG